MPEFKSDEEKYFAWYLDELSKVEIVKRWMYESHTFTLSKSKTYPILRQLKTKARIDQLSLMDEHVYTPDFLIEWNENALNKFVRIIQDETCPVKCPFFAVRGKQDNKLYTFIEIKPNFDQHGMERLFRINQKWMYDKYDLFIQLIKPLKLFERTFTPERFLKCDKVDRLRKIDFKIKSLNEYLYELDI